MESPADSSPILDWEESALRKRAGRAWGEWLAEGWEWDWFSTHTFSDPKGEGTHTSVGWSLSDRRFREWADSLAQKVGMGPEVYWVRAREPHKLRASTHFHALVGGVGKLRRDEAWGEWFRRNGQARIEPVNGLGAGYYVSKYILKAGGEIVFSDNAGAYMKGGPSSGRGFSGDLPPSWGDRHG